MLSKLCGLLFLCSPTTQHSVPHIDIHSAHEYRLANRINVAQELEALVAQSILTRDQVLRAQATAQSINIFCQIHDYPYALLYALHGRDFVGQIRCHLGNGSYYISLIETDQESRSRGIANCLLLNTYALMRHHARTSGHQVATISWVALAMDEVHGLSQEQLIRFYQARGAHVVVRPAYMRVQFLTN